jgi:hypothetical protein
MSPQFGYLTSSVGYDPEPANAPDYTYSGVGIGGELAIGGTIADGFVLGGALSGLTLPDPKVEGSGTEYDTNRDGQLSVISLFGDWYPNASSGFHVQGMVGFGVLDLDSDDDDDDNPAGLVLGAGAGYEWWIGDQWSAGIMGRIMYAPLTYEASNIDMTFSTFAPTALVTFTYH